MRRSVKIHNPILTVLVLAFFTVAGNSQARSQNTPAAHTQTQPDPAALAKALTPARHGRSRGQESFVPMLGIGDLLKVSVLGAPDSDQEVRVGADGTVVLNFIGTVPVAGQTTAQAQAAIAKKLVAGGFFTAAPGFGLYQGIRYAGRFGAWAKCRSRASIPCSARATCLMCCHWLAARHPRPGSSSASRAAIHPQAPISVSLSNDASESVTEQRRYLSRRHGRGFQGRHRLRGRRCSPAQRSAHGQHHMTVLQAIAMAEGTNPTAALNKAKLIRRSSGTPQEIPLPLKDMLSSKTPDVHSAGGRHRFCSQQHGQESRSADSGSHHSNRNRRDHVRSAAVDVVAAD